jgi:hypothetical protein
VLGLAIGLGDTECRVAAACLLGITLEARGRYREAIARLLPIVDGPDAEPARSVVLGSVPAYAATCARLGWLHSAIGQFDDRSSWESTERPRSRSRRSPTAFQRGSSLPAGQPHAVKAITRFKMILVMIRA